MGPSRSLLIRSASVSALLLATFTSSCRDSAELTAPAALAAKGGSGGPSVSSVVPDSSERGVTLDLTVNGSGFEQASTVRLERQGVPATGITTNTTTYVTSRKLIANVTIATDADTGKYDVAVISPKDRKGVGIEVFTVTYEIAELGILGGTWSRAHAINDQGEVVGASCTNDCLSTAFYWSEATGQVDLGGLPGYTRSAAYAINNRGDVFGEVECRATDPGCGGLSKRALVRWRWDSANGIWSITPVAGCSIASVPLSEHGQKFLINADEQCVKRTSFSLSVQTLSGGAVINEEALPSLYADGSNTATAISDAGMVAGWANEILERLSETSATLGWSQPVLWYRHGSQGWVVLQLPFPSGDLRAWATDVGEPDAVGRVRVAGYTEYWGGSSREHLIRPVRWTLQSDGAGGWQVSSSEVLGEITRRQQRDHFWAAAVNTAGDVVGLSGQGVLEASPVVWTISGGIELLPGLAGGTQGRAIDINNQGWIVGAVWDSKNNCDRAAIWRQR